MEKIIKFCKQKFFNSVKPDERALILRKEGLAIGERCHVYDKVSFGSEPYLIHIGNDVRITEGVRFITHDGGVWVLRNLGLLKNADLFGQIIIGNNVHIGIDTIIMPNVIIGDNVIIGAGAVVTRSIPSNSVAVGIPAKVIKTINEYYEKNKDLADFTKGLTFTEKKEYLINKYIKNNYFKGDKNGK